MNESVQPFSGRRVLGVVMLALGLLWTADNLGLTDAGAVLRWWPLLLVAFGVTRITGWGGERQFALGIVATVAGALLLSHELGWMHVGLGLLWPLAIVAVGIQILLRGSRAPYGSPAGADGSDYVHSFAFMGGAKTRCTSQVLRGAELSAIMGGVELDLRGAVPADGRVVVDAFAFMGGIDIVVPANWHVEFTATPLLGGLEDVRSLTATDEAAGTLVVRGLVALGGIQVGNEPSGRTVVVGVGRGGRRRWRERYERYDRGEVHVGPTGVHVRAEGPRGVREVRVDDRGVHTSEHPADAPPPPPPTEPR
jgi:hypothetical protein